MGPTPFFSLGPKPTSSLPLQGWGEGGPLRGSGKHAR